VERVICGIKLVKTMFFNNKRKSSNNKPIHRNGLDTTLGELILSEDQTIRRHAIGIKRVLERIELRRLRKKLGE